MKKALSVFLAMAIIFSISIFTAVSAYAENAPVFSINLVEETDTSVTVSVKLDSGEFNAVNLQVNILSDKISRCTAAYETDEFLDYIFSDIKALGGTGSTAINAHNAKFSSAMTVSYSLTDISLAEFVFEKTSADRVSCLDLDVSVTKCATLDDETLSAETVNNLIISGENCGDNLRWYFDSKTGLLTISGTGNMYSYDEETVAPWSEFNESITDIIIENGVRKIGDCAFCCCENLENIVIFPTVRSIIRSAFEENGDYTIWCCDYTYAENYAINNNLPFEYIQLVISDTDLTLADSETVTLNASFNTELLSSENLTWTSDNPEAVSVGNDGTVSALDFGEALITVTAPNGIEAFCNVSVGVKLTDGSDISVDAEEGIITGSFLINRSPDSVIEMFVNPNVSISADGEKIGTGDVITVSKESGEVYKILNVVIFGDVNGDGIYDGMDAMLVSCLAEGILSEEDVSEAVYLAADCNHDGVIDSFDVELLNQAGVLLSSVDQTKSGDELLETGSAYADYLSLIDQTYEAEETAEDEDIDEAFTFNFFDNLIELICRIIEAIRSALNYVIKF